MIGDFYHFLPSDVANNEGSREIISYSCFGPIEVVIYGITSDNEYYLDHTYPELYGDAELEHIYRIISKKELLMAIDSEIALCQHNGVNDIATALK